MNKIDIGKVVDNHCRNLANTKLGDISKFVKHNSGCTILSNGRNPLVSISHRGVILSGTQETLPFQLTSRNEEKREITISHILSSLNTPDISLNHLGIAYQVDDLDAEISRLVEIMRSSVQNIYEDPEGRKEDMRWLFLGDNTNGSPMFEIVLPEKSLGMRPHVQFDFDTSLSEKEIMERIYSVFGKDFFNWKLNIPDVGDVLYMGTFENEFMDMRIGLGTNKRSRKAHRNSMKELD